MERTAIKRMDGNRLRLTVYSLGHFWVDFSCALLMFSQLWGTPEWVMCVLLYNFCAFALQMPIGLMADRLSRNSCVAAMGCILVAISWLLPDIPLLAAVAAGVGNGCFHIGGGIDVLNRSEAKAAALGVFVSPGAFGIYFGTALGRAGTVPGWLSAAGLMLFGVLFIGLDLWLRGGLNSGNVPVELSVRADALWALVCCFLVVVLRSYVGMVLVFPWKTGAWAVASVCAVVFGKTAGGFLGDLIGMRRAAIGSLGLSALLFSFSSVPLAGVAAVFLFNMTMPITLWAAARLLPGGRGFAFGTLTFALFLGFLPAWLGWPVLMNGSLSYTLGALASLILLVLGLEKGGVR